VSVSISVSMSMSMSVSVSVIESSCIHVNSILLINDDSLTHDSCRIDFYLHIWATYEFARTRLLT